MAISNEQRSEMKQLALAAQQACLDLFDALDEGKPIVNLAVVFNEINEPLSKIQETLRFEAANAILTGEY